MSTHPPPREGPSQEVGRAAAARGGLTPADADLARLIAAHQGFVAKLAREYGHLGVPLEDLINEGNIGLLQAARRFDALRGTRFLTYAAAWVRKHILGAIERHARIVRLPAYRMRTLRRMLSAEKALAQQLGRPPELEELSDRLHAQSGDVRRLQQCRFHEVSIEADAEEERPTLRPLTNPNALNPEQELLRDETYRVVRLALVRLGERERSVLVQRFGLSDGRVRTLREVADAMGLSRERVRQIESAARDRVARYLARRIRRSK
jgi:RNA polymerase primary sigma factor